MKITDDVLQLLSARLIDKNQRIWKIGDFLIKWIRDNTIEGVHFDVWEFGHNPAKSFVGHIVTDVEEMVRFAYADGLVDGRNSLRQDLKELIREE